MNISQTRESGNPTSKQIETLLNEFDVAKITGMSVASVRRWRLLRQGPRFLKIGSAVRYRTEDISAWLNSRPTGGEQIRARS
jgi:predicted DNA-binding transcriptional regulator AlpA